jgi:hypothetical protein
LNVRVAPVAPQLAHVGEEGGSLRYGITFRPTSRKARHGELPGGLGGGGQARVRA